MKCIKQLRYENEFTLKNLSEIMGVSIPTLHSWEAGKTVPYVDQAIKLANVFGVNVYDIKWKHKKR